MELGAIFLYFSADLPFLECNDLLIYETFKFTKLFYMKEETGKNNKTLMLREAANNNESSVTTVFQSSNLTFQCNIQNNPQHPLYMRQVPTHYLLIIHV